jgi:hypothetical protein
MATRSMIGRINPDDTITAIYCHFDGYPEGVGKDLVKFYDTDEKVNELINLGDISALSSSPESCDSYAKRGEKDKEARTYSNFEDLLNVGNHIWAEYFYIFNHDFWNCYNSSATKIF